MAQVIIYSDGGSVKVVHPSPGKDIQQVQSKVVPNGITSFIVDESVLPTNMEYFNSWVMPNPNQSIVVEDVAKAKEIAKREAKLVANKITTFIQSAFLLNEDPGVTQDDVTNAYEQVKSIIDNAIQVSDMSIALNNFRATYN